MGPTSTSCVEKVRTSSALFSVPPSHLQPQGGVGGGGNLLRIEKEVLVLDLDHNRSTLS